MEKLSAIGGIDMTIVQHTIATRSVLLVTATLSDTSEYIFFMVDTVRLKILPLFPRQV